MSEQTILLDENDLLSLLNGGSFHTLVGNQKVVIKQSLLKPISTYVELPISNS